MIRVGKTCTICGCTDAQRCPEGCHWSGGPEGFDPICSRCTRDVIDLGAVLAMFAHKQGMAELQARGGYQALRYLCIDEQGPRVVLNRWQRQISDCPPPTLAELHEFLATGRAMLKDAEAAIAEGRRHNEAARASLAAAAEAGERAVAKHKGRKAGRR
jgi:hypothetical protein